jgi:hypothetical protein
VNPLLTCCVFGLQLCHAGHLDQGEETGAWAGAFTFQLDTLLDSLRLRSLSAFPLQIRSCSSIALRSAVRLAHFVPFWVLSSCQVELTVWGGTLRSRQAIKESDNKRTGIKSLLSKFKVRLLRCATCSLDAVFCVASRIMHGAEYSKLTDLASLWHGG